ncbi:hypothetical protein KY290_007516 [Solanum tuberosum]|uniref:Serine-tRNA synthetase type1 N-terminal domain-containing protein n=1 Tax=Solanum tuberosum TaxID=4113 RepID=A0ABQ7W699_SOLTU|nr:hypothetical protein KY290_007516 [Solanum tuberosum]
MVLHCCFIGTTLHSLKLAAIPHFSRTLTFCLTPYYSRPLLPFVVRSLSASAIQTSTTDEYQVVKPQWKAAIDFKWIRDNKESAAVNSKNRNSNANLEVVLELYEKLLNVQKEIEKLRAERNAVANKMKGKLEPSECQKLIEEGKNLKEELVTLEEDPLKLTDEQAQYIPNMTHPDVPLGGEDSSTVRKMVLLI